MLLEIASMARRSRFCGTQQSPNQNRSHDCVGLESFFNSPRWGGGCDSIASGGCGPLCQTLLAKVHLACGLFGSPWSRHRGELWCEREGALLFAVSDGPTSSSGLDCTYGS